LDGISAAEPEPITTNSTGDFSHANPCLSVQMELMPRLSRISLNHPDMPWDRTELFVATIQAAMMRWETIKRWQRWRAGRIHLSTTVIPQRSLLLFSSWHEEKTGYMQWNQHLR
jgi:hypothetical protein